MCVVDDQGAVKAMTLIAVYRRLFTDNAAIVTGALLAEKPRLQSLVRCWFRTNGVGCVDPQVVERPANLLQLPLLGLKARALARGGTNPSGAHARGSVLFVRRSSLRLPYPDCLGQHLVIGRHIEDVAVVPRAETGSDPNHSIDDRADERDLPAWDSRLLPREKLHTLGTAPQRGFDFFVRNRSHRLIP